MSRATPFDAGLDSDLVNGFSTLESDVTSGFSSLESTLNTDLGVGGFLGTHLLGIENELATGLIDQNTLTPYLAEILTALGGTP